MKSNEPKSAIKTIVIAIVSSSFLNSALGQRQNFTNRPTYDFPSNK